MKIAYLVPEFPSQTHAFFWNEVIALRKIGIETCLVSTRPPKSSLVSHSWAAEATERTTYLSQPSPLDLLRIVTLLLRAGPYAWTRGFAAMFSGCSLSEGLRNIPLLLAAGNLILVVKSQNAAHVHCHSCGRAALVALIANRLVGLSYSLTLHGDLDDYGGQQVLKFKYAEFALTITQQLIMQIRKRLGSAGPVKLGLAPMGVDTNRFKRTTPYTPWNGSDTLRLFSCGRLNFTKGHQDLIRAVRLLKDSCIPVILEIAGEDDTGGGGYRRDLECLIKELDVSANVKLLGAVSHQRVIAALKEAHLFVLASHHEPLGVAIMEAMSFEVPVIGTNRGGVPELVEHGCDGYLVPPQEPRVLADAIRRVASAPLTSMAFSKRGRAKVQSYFRSDRSARELKRLLSECFSSGSD